jgi:hypothetical protein
MPEIVVEGGVVITGKNVFPFGNDVHAIEYETAE